MSIYKKRTKTYSDSNDYNVKRYCTLPYCEIYNWKLYVMKIREL